MKTVFELAWTVGIQGGSSGGLCSPTLDHWRFVTTVDNCSGKTTLSVSQIVQGYVTPYRVGPLKETIEAGLEARDILNMNGENSIKRDWNTTNIQELVRGISVRLGGRGACEYMCVALPFVETVPAGGSGWVH